MSRLAILAFVPLLLAFEPFRSTNKAIEEGNARMKAGKPEEALSLYDKAAGRLPDDPGVRFNRGSALYALSRFDEAAQEFLRATEAKDPALKASAFYNLGNAFFRAEKYKESIEAYKRSLATDPKDVRAKWNLELALRKMKEEEKKKQDGDKDKDKDKDKDDKNKEKDQKDKDQKNQDQDKKDQDQNKKDQEKERQQKDQPKPQDEKGEQEQPPQPQPQPGEKPPDQKEIEAVLDSLERSPKGLEQQRARIRAARRRPPAKDW